MIEGVRVRSLPRHADDRGSLTEVLRKDWPEFTQFGQAIVTVNRPGSSGAGTGTTARPT